MLLLLFHIKYIHSLSVLTRIFEDPKVASSPDRNPTLNSANDIAQNAFSSTRNGFLLFASRVIFLLFVYLLISSLFPDSGLRMPRLSTIKIVLYASATLAGGYIIPNLVLLDLTGYPIKEKIGNKQFYWKVISQGVLFVNLNIEPSLHKVALMWLRTTIISSVACSGAVFYHWIFTNWDYTLISVMIIFLFFSTLIDWGLQRHFFFNEQEIAVFPKS